MKNIYLHYNPADDCSMKLIKNLNKASYDTKMKFGTIYIRDIPDTFVDTCVWILRAGLTEISLSYGETKLSYSDRMKYCKAIGRQYARLNSSNSVIIKGVRISSEITTVLLQTKTYGFDFEIELNHKTRKLFVSTPTYW